MRVTSAVVLLVSAVVGNAWGNTIEYKVTDLGPVGASFSRANAINSSGQVVGTDENGDGFSYIPGQGTTSLGTLAPNAINVSGQIAGWGIREGAVLFFTRAES